MLNSKQPHMEKEKKMAAEMEMSKVSEGEAYPMKGGHGLYSYSNNSSYQGAVRSAAKKLASEAIVESLDILKFSPLTTVRVADLGCSVGPNTFFAVQDILEAVELKYCRNQGLLMNYQIPEFQVFFNDHSSNDFNTLFLTLPPDRRYHAAGVPGSFYYRLFPSNSLHVVHMSYAIHWLSRVPKEVVDKSSPAWNKGRIYYSSASDEVVEAYSAQWEEDMARFLKARGEEMVEGGLVIIIFIARLDGTPHSQVSSNIAHDLLGSCLVDMAKKGVVSQEKVDMFNVPIYYMSPGELEAAVERNGCFSIERMESVPPLTYSGGSSSQMGSRLTAKASSMIARSVMEGLIKAHFGEEILDQLFDSLSKKLEDEVSVSDLANNIVNICAVLKRKAIN